MRQNITSKNISIEEITLRKYERPINVGRREVIKKICLSLGLLQEGDSRDVIVDILKVLVEASSKREWITSKEVRNRAYDNRKSNNLKLIGLADSNIRRQLKRLKDLMIIDTEKNHYAITEFMSLEELFESKIEPFIIKPTINRIKDYLKKSDKEFGLK
ncbi:MAG: hypothetical protein ACOCRX_01080 [Candidatus Woesearchaeota archaeon]